MLGFTLRDGHSDHTDANAVLYYKTTRGRQQCREAVLWHLRPGLDDQAPRYRILVGDKSGI
jgi:hypothetical protein